MMKKDKIEMIELKQEIRRLTKRFNELKDKFDDEDGNYKLGGEYYSVRKTNTTQSRIDSTRLKNEMSRVYDMYLKHSKSTRFDVKLLTKRPDEFQVLK